MISFQFISALCLKHFEALFWSSTTISHTEPINSYKLYRTPHSPTNHFSFTTCWVACGCLPCCTGHQLLLQRSEPWRIPSGWRPTTTRMCAKLRSSSDMATQISPKKQWMPEPVVWRFSTIGLQPSKFWAEEFFSGCFRWLYCVKNSQSHKWLWTFCTQQVPQGQNVARESSFGPGKVPSLSWTIGGEGKHKLWKKT